MDRDDCSLFVPKKAVDLAAKTKISKGLGDLEDNERKWPQPELPGTNNIEEAVQQTDHCSGSSRLRCAVRVGCTGSTGNTSFPLALAKSNDLPTTQNKAKKVRHDVLLGEDSGDSDKSGSTGCSCELGKGGEFHRDKSSKLLPLPGSDNIPADADPSTIASGESEISSGGDNSCSKGADKGD